MRYISKTAFKIHKIMLFIYLLNVKD